MSPTRPMKLRILKLHPNAQAPTYATAGAGCFDLYAATVDGKQHIGSVVSHGYPIICGTGLAFEVPDGHVLAIFSRSGQGFKHEVRLSNCVGIIDADYRGEVMVKLTADDNFDESTPAYFARPGDRIAQAMLMPVPRVEFEVAEQLSITERAAGGFGSTGAA